MTFYWLTLGVLAAWRITHLLNAEDGPWNLLDCFYCLSLWVAAPLACLLGDGWKQRLLLWPAISGGAILLQKVTSREPVGLTAEYREEERNE
jgi:hypothetical protein